MLNLSGTQIDYSFFVLLRVQRYAFSKSVGLSHKERLLFFPQINGTWRDATHFDNEVTMKEHEQIKENFDEFCLV